MSTSIINRVNDQLQEIEQQLGEFRTTVDFLKQAKSRVAEAENAVFSARDYHTEKLQDVEKVYSDFKRLSGMVSDLSGKISSIDFPKRLQSIDDSLATLLPDFSKATAKLMAEVSEAIKAIEKADMKGAVEEVKKKSTESTKLLQDSAAASTQKVIAASESTTKELQTVFKKIDESKTAQINALAALKIQSHFETSLSVLQSVLRGVEDANNTIAELFAAFENYRRVQNDQLNDLKKDYNGAISNLSEELKKARTEQTEFHNIQAKSVSLLRGLQIIAVLMLATMITLLIVFK